MTVHEGRAAGSAYVARRAEAQYATADRMIGRDLGKHRAKASSREMVLHAADQAEAAHETFQRSRWRWIDLRDNGKCHRYPGLAELIGDGCGLGRNAARRDQK